MQVSRREPGGARREEATGGATHIPLTHAHFDHASDTLDLARKLGVPAIGPFDLMTHCAEYEGIQTAGFNQGGTVNLGGVRVTMVRAAHSSRFAGKDGPVAAGSECGYMTEHGGRTMSFSSDTDVMADMGVFQALHTPEVGILCAGGHLTMDMRRAADAARRFSASKLLLYAITALSTRWSNRQWR